MALGTATIVKRAEGDGPLRCDVLRFAGDDAYAAGGTANFEAYARAAIGRGDIEIVGVVPGHCGGYVPQYDFANDTLAVYEAGADAAPLDELGAAADVSGTTFEVSILSV